MDEHFIAFGFFLVLNVFTFFLCFYDKRCAVYQAYRVSENVFFLLAFLGGEIGLLFGMHVFHHKTKKKYFVWIVRFFFLLHLVLLFPFVKNMIK